MPTQMPIYRAEAEAGLGEALANHIVASLCPILANEQVIASVQNEVKIKDVAEFEQILAVNREQFDLHYLYTILASTGWNDNDDVFDRYEAWAARDSAEDKPFNLQHDPNRIIGHITGNCVVNSDYELVNSNLVIDELPDKFHILTSAVIYKHLKGKDPNLTAATAQLLDEISKGEWFVSMEALFANFDYAVITPVGEHQIIQRNEESAFLSKHLRAYGGKGLYENHRVGRLIRNLTFSGKGLVRVPGNPESIIFEQQDSDIFKGMGLAELNIQPNKLIVSSKTIGESSMSDTNEQVVRSLEVQQTKDQQAIASLESRLKAMDEAQVTAKFDTLAANVASRDETIVGLQAKLEEAEAASLDSVKSLKELKDAKAEADKKLVELTAKLDDIEAESVKTNRISALVDKGVDKVDAEGIVETYAGINNEQFEAVVKTQSELVEAKKHEGNPFAKGGDKD